MTGTVPRPASQKVSNCCVCAGSRHGTLYELDRFHVVRCLRCGLVSLATSPDRKALEEMYGQEYFEQRQDYFFHDAVPESGNDQGESVRENFRAGLALVEEYASGRRLLDFGCAVGTFLSMAADAGWEVSGVDISDYAVAHCRDTLGFDARCGELKDAGFASETFDVVTMWDVIEHLTDPVAQLAEVHRILKPGGIVLVDTPNEESLLRSLARVGYVATAGVLRYPVEKLYHQYHLYYFTRRTLQDALAKNGFEPVLVTSRPIPDVKGRARVLERVLVNMISIPERLLDRGYELIAVAKKIRGAN
jgi:2-polyprenyl-3-methyl-5-hydroxy-6-metoxy-1,4-benzoquinol methylase